MGLGVIVLLVENRPASARTTPAPSRRRRCAAASGCSQDPRFRRAADRRRRRSASRTMSDAFVYLALQRRMDFDATAVPAAVRRHARSPSCVLAIPLGRLADRIGRGRVFLGGYVAAARACTSCCSAPAIGAGRARRRARRCSAPTTPPPTACCPRWRARSLPEHAARQRTGARRDRHEPRRGCVASVAFGALWTLRASTHRDHRLRRSRSWPPPRGGRHPRAASSAHA